MFAPRSSSLVIALALTSAWACSKTESTPSSSGTAPSASTPAPTTTAALSAPAAASVATDNATDAAAAPVTSEAKTPVAPGSAAAASGTGRKDGGAAGSATSAASGSAAECGTKPQPDCPLQAWMKANANPPMLAGDLPNLATALDKIAAFAPPGYPNWGSISKDGANAARAGDMTATKASCRTCHDQYKTKYKNELRGRKV